MCLGTTYSPTVPVGGATSYKLRPVLTYSNGYLEGYRRFQGDFYVGGWEEGDMLEDFPWRNLSWGKQIFMKGALNVLAVFKKKKKKQWKNKYEKVFSTVSKEKH